MPRKATQKMIDFANDISEVLDIEKPMTDDFDEVGKFISENKDDFYLTMELEAVELESWMNRE